MSTETKINQNQIKDLVNLSDIKILSQTIAEKGWICLSKTNELTSTSYPTICNYINGLLSGATRVTDIYIIGGSTIEIVYYKKNGVKIIVNATSSVLNDVEIIKSYIGYSPYFIYNTNVFVLNPFFTKVGDDWTVEEQTTLSPGNKYIVVPVDTSTHSIIKLHTRLKINNGRSGLKPLLTPSTMDSLLGIDAYSQFDLWTPGKYTQGYFVNNEWINIDVDINKTTGACSLIMTLDDNTLLTSLNYTNNTRIANDEWRIGSRNDLSADSITIDYLSTYVEIDNVAHNVMVSSDISSLVLPYNSNLYTMMYIGDNYNEDFSNISGNATRLLPQANEVTVSGATVSLDLKGNTVYTLADTVTSLTLNSAEISSLETVIYFTTGNSISFTGSSSLKWGGGGFTPSLEANTIYCIAICNGLAEIDSFGTVS